jgi:SM-20-related protein
MLNLAALQGSSMARDPFEYVIVDDFVPVAAAPSVSVDFPKIPTTGSFPLSEISYGPAFAELVAELNGPGFERGIANLFGLDLSEATTAVCTPTPHGRSSACCST